MTTARILGPVLAGAVVTIGTGLLHRRAGLPLWQALAYVLIAMITGPGGAAGLGGSLPAIHARTGKALSGLKRFTEPRRNPQ